MSEITYEAASTEAAPAHDVAIAREPFLRRMWPAAVIILGLGLSAAWTCLLGYGIAKLLMTAI